MSKPIVYISPSRIETEWKCARARYWGHEWEDTGLEPTGSAIELIFGGMMHEALASIARREGTHDAGLIKGLASASAVSVRETFTPITGELRARELGALAEGLIISFWQRVWPRLMREYEIVQVEKEFFFQIDETADYILKFRCRPDLIVRHKHTDKLWYIEYKTTSNDSPKWVNSWLRAVQLHVGCTAAAAELGEEVAGCIVLGLYKGYDKYDRLNSVFTYGFLNRGRPGITVDQWSYEYRAKWERVFIPDHMDMWDWVAAMPDEVAGAQFPETPPMFIRQDLIDDFMEQRRVREQVVFQGMERLRLYKKEPSSVDAYATRLVLNEAFPQTFSQCTPSWGRECQFNQACWMDRVKKDPVGSGYYIKREPRPVDDAAV